MRFTPETEKLKATIMPFWWENPRRPAGRPDPQNGDGVHAVLGVINYLALSLFGRFQFSIHKNDQSGKN